MREVDVTTAGEEDAGRRGGSGGADFESRHTFGGMIDALKFYANDRNWRQQWPRYRRTADTTHARRCRRSACVCTPT